ncbi:uncharacterized protein LOC131467514 isoform X1 [Solea solea]|uniref:uncharacterized protein LOC131467514 isoform X1 n=1 Tax=Solea solea TaxID=90069 RepID=UPI00272B783B|nr:uncharacterized protein LOC131467514 isoform X1 [Solea solea]XP_058497578.1 uncharacterized protein LOC131467514 isoform X1 [Solea solea]XP_058497657.1 uncharacterized protein LOC131467514 isoform X1 [Solea solea]
MEEEMQQLRDLVMQLRTDNERLLRERALSPAGPSTANLASPASGREAPVLGPSASVTERLVVVPRDRRCPMFNGRTGIVIAEWTEEIQACMRVRHLSVIDQAFFIFDHLEGEAREEIKYRTSVERGDPIKVLAILKELYGCAQSYVTLQQAFFARKQQEGETLQEFSLALMALMEKVEQCAPDGLLNARVLLRDQFVEHVLDSALRRELKQFVRGQPDATLLEVRAEAIRWEREGFPGGTRERSYSLPSTYGLQCRVQSGPGPAPLAASYGSELGELKELLKRQQEQLNQLTQTVASLQNRPIQTHPPRSGPLICRRCHQPGHFARECVGERVPARANSATGFPSNRARPFPRSHQSEN